MARPVFSRVLAYGLGILVILAAAVPIFLQAPVVEKPVDAKRPGIIRVMSYNIQQSFNAEGVLDIGMIMNAIRSNDPDLIGLEESLPTRQVSSNVDPVYKIANALGYYAYLGAGPQYQTPGVSILSRFPITMKNCILLPANRLPRTAAHVRVTVVGRNLDFYAVHLGVFTERDRIQQSAALLNFIHSTKGSDATPSIVVGDFNDHPATTVYDRMVNHGYKDAWVAAGHPLNDKAGYTYDSYVPYETIDYIFVSKNPNITVKACNVLHHFYGSDHLPITAVVKLP